MRHKAVVAMLAWTALLVHFPSPAVADMDPLVVIHQNPDQYVLDNGHVAATISKASGEILSLKFERRELLADARRVAPGIWFTAPAATTATDRILVDPSTNRGDSGEVSISVSGPLAIDIRYGLGRGDRALYASEILNHSANLPPARIFCGGFQLRLNPDLFDRLTVGKTRSHAIPSAQEWMAAKAIVSTEARRMTSGHFAGQIYCAWDDAAMQMETPVYGFSGAKAGVGLWIINPSSEYLSRGGNVIAPTGWLDSVDGAPTLMNRWAGEPGPGAGISADRGVSWSHVVGPFLLYCNQGSFQDAQARAIQEKSQWPYVWAAREESVPRQERAALGGQIVLNQSPLAGTAFPTSPPLSGQTASVWQNRYREQTPTSSEAPATQPQTMTQLHGAMIGLSWDQDWQTNLFDNQVWTRAADDGKFSFPNVLPGNYILHVYCDGQFDEAALTGIKLTPGQKLELGKIVWTPRHYGDFVWQLGYPDRSAAEFRHGNDSTRWGLWSLDQKEFPVGVNYFIGKSDPRKDWNFAQSPGSTWAIHFPLGFVPDRGCGFLDVALAGGSDAAGLTITLNGNDISRDLYRPNSAIARPKGAATFDDIAHDQLSGCCREYLYPFPHQDLKLGDNILLFRVDGSRPTDGIMYDCLRMEIRVDSMLLAGQGPPDTPLPSLSRGHSGFDFGQSYVGDPSGNYTALSRQPQASSPPPPPGF
jgi:rhamnogalacturonan endolyase